MSKFGTRPLTKSKQNTTAKALRRRHGRAVVECDRQAVFKPIWLEFRHGDASPAGCVLLACSL